MNGKIPDLKLPVILLKRHDMRFRRTYMPMCILNGWEKNLWG